MKLSGKIKSLAILSLVLGMFVVTSCKKGDEYVNALPKDASLVTSFDLKSMAAKGNLQGENGAKALKKIGEALKGEMKGSEALVDEILKDPDASGLKLTDKVYFFMEAGAVNAGFLARVSDSGKLETLVEKLVQEGASVSLKKEGGCTYAVADPGIMAYTDKAFLTLVGLKGGSGEDLVHAAQMMLRQKESESFASTDDFKNLDKADGDILSFISMGVLPSEYTSLMTMGLPSDINLSEAKYLAAISFNKGEANLTFKNLTTNKAILELQKKQDVVVKPLKGTFLDYFNRNACLWIGLGLNGEAYFDVLKENPTVKQLLDSSMIPVDFEAILGAMDGDVVIAMPNAATTDFIVWAEVNNETFLRTFEDLKPILAMTGGRMTLQNDGDKGYCYRSVDNSMVGTNELYFGVKDDCFYLTTKRELIDERPKGQTVADTPWGKEAKGKLAFFGVNIDELTQKATASGMTRQTAGLQMFDYMSGGADKADEARMDLVLKDKEHNFLEQLVGLIP